MTDWPTNLKMALETAAVAWPLAAGLTVVLWSKARARQPQAVAVKVRA